MNVWIEWMDGTTSSIEGVTEVEPTLRGYRIKRTDDNGLWQWFMPTTAIKCIRTETPV